MTQTRVPSASASEPAKPDSEVVLDTVTGPETLDAIQVSLDGFFAVHRHVPGMVRLDLSIAAAEIGANIIEHSGAGQTIHLRMTIGLFPDEVRIDFIDDGVPAEMKLDAAALPEDDAESGRGLTIAQAVLSELTYHRDSVNHWTLVSRRY